MASVTSGTIQREVKRLNDRFSSIRGFLADPMVGSLSMSVWFLRAVMPGNQAGVKYQSRSQSKKDHQNIRRRPRPGHDLKRIEGDHAAQGSDNKNIDHRPRPYDFDQCVEPVTDMPSVAHRKTTAYK